MALKTFVKINSINNLSDARYCAGMGVDVMGFNIDQESPGYVTKETFDEISGWVSGPEMALELGGSTEGTEEYNASYIETLSSSDHITEITNSKKNLILKTTLAQVNSVIGHDFDFLHLYSDSDLLSPEEIEEIKNLSERFKVILGFGLNADNIELILNKTGVHGIAITAGEEIRPGYKDFDELADILEVLELDD